MILKLNPDCFELPIQIMVVGCHLESSCPYNVKIIFIPSSFTKKQVIDPLQTFLFCFMVSDNVVTEVNEVFEGFNFSTSIFVTV